MSLWIAIFATTLATVFLVALAPQPWFPQSLTAIADFALLGIPAFGIGVICILWRKYRLASCIPLAIFILGIFLADKYMPSAVRLALPSSAQEVQEFYHEGGNGDFMRLLKARLPKEDYLRYVTNLHLEGKYDPTKDDDHERIIRRVAGPPWWDLKFDLTTCYYTYTPERDFLEYTIYQDQWVYLCAMSW